MRRCSVIIAVSCSELELMKHDLVFELHACFSVQEGNINPSKSEVDHAFLLQLLFWFKQTFKYVLSFPFAFHICKMGDI